MSGALAEYHETHPTMVEFNKQLGPKWAICRDTEVNRERYGVCLTRGEYRAACSIAMKRRIVAQGEG